MSLFGNREQPQVPQTDTQNSPPSFGLDLGMNLPVHAQGGEPVNPVVPPQVEGEIGNEDKISRKAVLGYAARILAALAVGSTGYKEVKQLVDGVLSPGENGSSSPTALQDSNRGLDQTPTSVPAEPTKDVPTLTPEPEAFNTPTPGLAETPGSIPTLTPSTEQSFNTPTPEPAETPREVPTLTPEAGPFATPTPDLAETP